LKSGKNIIDIRTTDKAGNVKEETRTIQYKKESPGVPGFEALIFVAVICVIAIAMAGKRRS
jgi:hypothetical protein